MATARRHDKLACQAVSNSAFPASLQASLLCQALVFSWRCYRALTNCTSDAVALMHCSNNGLGVN